MLERCRLRVRASLLPTHEGEKIVLRLLEDDIRKDAGSQEQLFDQLGLSALQQSLFSSVLSLDGGLILASGPTGSGKSTFLYTALQLLNSPSRNIITVEDPVERRIPGASQVEVSAKAGLSFAELLPKLLRQDPDVLLIGEIRDSETAKTAVEAGISGCLVLSTVHASSSLQTITRMLQA